MIQYSDVTGKYYETKDQVFFRNIIQCGFYLSNGCPLTDVFADSSGKVVMVFPKSEHEVLIKKWIENKKESEK